MEVPTTLDISRMPIKEVSVKQFIRLAKRFELPKEEFNVIVANVTYVLEHGTFLGFHQTESGKWRRLYLKKIWFKEFTLGYSVHKNTKSGKELLISNMPLPPGPVVTKKRK